MSVAKTQKASSSFMYSSSTAAYDAIPCVYPSDGLYAAYARSSRVSACWPRPSAPRKKMCPVMVRGTSLSICRAIQQGRGWAAGAGAGEGTGVRTCVMASAIPSSCRPSPW